MDGCPDGCVPAQSSLTLTPTPTQTGVPSPIPSWTANHTSTPVGPGPDVVVESTGTATPTRTPEPPGIEELPTSTPGGATTWMTLIPCRQYEPCAFSIRDQNALLGGAVGSVEGLVPDGVEILAQSVQIAGAVCAACGCPRSGSPILRVLISLDDVETMQGLGWVVHR